MNWLGTTLFCGSLCGLLLGGIASAQERQVLSQAPAQASDEEGALPVSPAAEAFAALLKSAEEALKESRSYRIRIESRWSMLKNGAIQNAGKNHLTFLSSGENCLRIEGRETLEKPAQLILVSDGETLTKAHSQTQQHSIEQTKDSKLAMANCELAQSLLKICGAQVLLSPNPHATVFNQLVQIVDLGVDHEDRHFRMTLQDGQAVEVWFSGSAPHLPSRLTSTESHMFHEAWKQELHINSSFKWELNAPMNESDFRFEAPDGWKQVRNLSHSLANFGIEEVLSQPLPQLRLTTLSGQPFSVEQESLPVLLYFWATWAVPSSDNLPEMVEFSKQLESQGVKVVAVNVAESPESVIEFMKLNQIDETIALDPEGAAIHALHISELPAVVLIGKDRTVQGIHLGTDKSIRPELLRQVKSLLTTQPSNESNETEQK